MVFIEQVKRLKEENDILLVAHNYQLGVIQDAADYTGDSFGLARKVTEEEAENVIFCGVDFMAESAVVLNSEKKIIHPEPKAQCPMAAMVDMGRLRRYKKDNPDTAVVSYVNTNVETKVESDICCTSSNAVKVVRSLEQDKILFLPDKNLGNYIKRFVKDKTIDLWEGYCGTHDKISVKDIEISLKDHPQAEVMVHPECKPEVVDIAHFVGSTAGILKQASESSSKEFIVGTEVEMGHRLRKENPDKTFIFPGDPLCQNMKRITPEKVLRSMEDLRPVVKIDEKLIEKARRPLERMIKVGRGE